MARRAIGFLLFLFSLALVGCDHATKLAARAALERRGPVALLPGVLDLHYAENRDTAFSMLRMVAFPGKVAVLGAMSAIGLGAVLVTWWRRRRAGNAEQVAYALLAAGAFGNAVDRIRSGYVIDFIEIHRWPIFNVADVAIVAGAALLASTAIRRSRRNGDTAASAPP
jgi:signal peptidase II